MKIDLTSKSDQIPISKLTSLLKLIASGAMKEVEEQADRLTESMTTTATANAAVVANLEAVATWHEKEQERMENVIALAQGKNCQYLQLLPLRDDLPYGSK